MTTIWHISNASKELLSLAEYLQIPILTTPGFLSRTPDDMAIILDAATGNNKLDPHSFNLKYSFADTEINDFEFKNIFLQSLMERLFSEAVKKMVTAFEHRAKKLYDLFYDVDENEFLSEVKKMDDYYEELNKDSDGDGMSDDYDIALENGSNMIRVGSKIFGKRNY